MQCVNSLLQWWHGKNLPLRYIFPPDENLPKDFFKLIRLYFRTWVIHPLKRRLAKYYLLILQSFFNLKVIAITGSSGKTTTKDMLQSILSREGETVSSYLNIDSTFNIPATILKCNPSTKYLILEMGVEYRGDMSFYRWLVNPDIAIITNIYQTHTLYFGNEEGVLEEKSGIVKGLGENAVVVLNSENKPSQKIIEKSKAKIIWFGKNGAFEAINLKLSFEGSHFILKSINQKIEINIPLTGKHFVENALAASTAASTLNISFATIKAGLEKLIPQKQRMTVKTLKNGAVLLDDTYNNNPSAALATFFAANEIRGTKKLILVYGDMKELGNSEIQDHLDIGKAIENLGVDFAILVGPLSIYTRKSLKKTQNLRVETAQEVLPILKSQVTKNSLILIKGARSLKLEEVVNKLK
ncbi:MAG: hypothetical protein A3F61_01300 [Candidatus Blackburnbacteria bacterium RIFCSPHIGHO2_12_FULL_41_13b]|uniref:UDP-N-acetylmuramoyl-tripeptide--D-alanyl-D-alanine ligase n=1 Tax=Candidatus Blackburnbacteria bacterium RIFCSPHIGHO2_12_FULL_41_13b TaxID=1797517 RepID=A0A1G1VAM2_9BACT|nr:MAG: hypothetical protein A3F61_01300 [Candidatus Blackburnbacteria bacterium RIFCSPHIGHO2_12_FULL_41_13b]